MPYEGFSAYTPHQCAGIRSEPPRSLPSSRAQNPAATAAAAPPEDPPGVREASHGLLVVPNSSLYDWQSDAHTGRFVLPTTIAPARRNRPTASASFAGT